MQFTTRKPRTIATSVLLLPSNQHNLVRRTHFTFAITLSLYCSRRRGKNNTTTIIADVAIVLNSSAVLATVKCRTLTFSAWIRLLCPESCMNFRWKVQIKTLIINGITYYFYFSLLYIHIPTFKVTFSRTDYGRFVR